MVVMKPKSNWWQPYCQYNQIYETIKAALYLVKQKECETASSLEEPGDVIIVDTIKHPSPRSTSNSFFSLSFICMTSLFYECICCMCFCESVQGGQGKSL